MFCLKNLLNFGAWTSNGAKLCFEGYWGTLLKKLPHLSPPSPSHRRKTTSDSKSSGPKSASPTPSGPTPPGTSDTWATSSPLSKKTSCCCPGTCSRTSQIPPEAKGKGTRWYCCPWSKAHLHYSYSWDPGRSLKASGSKCVSVVLGNLPGAMSG